MTTPVAICLDFNIIHMIVFIVIQIACLFVILMTVSLLSRPIIMNKSSTTNIIRSSLPDLGQQSVD